MMRVIPFFHAMMLPWLLLLASCMRGGTLQELERIPALEGDPLGWQTDLPTPANPCDEVPELRAWCLDMPVTMGADSACALPVAVFPALAALCGDYGPVRQGFPTAPLGVSFHPGKRPLVAYSHVVHVDGVPVLGLIGWPVMRRFVWHLELQRHRHHFHHSVPQPVRAWTSLPLKKTDVAQVELPGCGPCTLDTGAPYGLYLSAAEWRRFLAKHPHEPVGFYSGNSPSAGGAFESPYVHVARVQLGPLSLHNVRVCRSFSPLTGPFMLGREALAQFDLWVDGPAGRIYYRPLRP